MTSNLSRYSWVNVYLTNQCFDFRRNLKVVHGIPEDAGMGLVVSEGQMVNLQ